jgi:hypothetical protein
MYRQGQSKNTASQITLIPWAGRSAVDRESRTLEAPGSNPGQSTTYPTTGAEKPNRLEAQRARRANTWVGSSAWLEHPADSASPMQRGRCQIPGGRGFEARPTHHFTPSFWELIQRGSILD